MAPARREHGSGGRSRGRGRDAEGRASPPPPLKPAELLWVTATSALILFLALTPQLFILAPYFLRTPTFTTAQLLRALLPFNAGILAIFYNYRLCILTSPGRVPLDWEPDWDALGLDPPGSAHDARDDTANGRHGNNAAQDERDGEHRSDTDSESVASSVGDSAHERLLTRNKPADPLAIPRFCKTCNVYKPPRAHHCKHCKACTLRMDHHCPWIANCVGFGNAPHFLRFLYAVQYSILYHFLLISARIADWWSPPGAFWMPPGNAEMVLILLNYLGGLIVLLLVGVFCVYHTWLLCSGTTTIESSERDRVRTMVRRGRIREIQYPFDLGTYANICSILGPTPLHWLIPGLRTQQGDGLAYPCRSGTPAWLPYAWPPRDPTHPYHDIRKEDADPRALRKRDELERGWEWERRRVSAAEEEEHSGDEDGRHSHGAYASSSAFTYGSEQLNPGLLPSNSQRRRADGTAADGLRARVRRGSEGYEVKPRRFDLAFEHEQREWELAQQEDAELAQGMTWPSPTSVYGRPPSPGSVYTQTFRVPDASDDEDRANASSGSE